MSGMPRVLRGMAVIEGAAQRNTAAEGLSYSGGNVWAADDGTQAALVFCRVNAEPVVVIKKGSDKEGDELGRGR